MAQHWFFVGKMVSRSAGKPLDYAVSWHIVTYAAPAYK